jgi:serine/threonine protein kinase/tetratricopeptide (TPR) repeat protein
VDWDRRGAIIICEAVPYEGLGSVKTDHRRICQACGAIVPAGSEVCPVCALRGALDEGQETVELNVDLTPSLSELRFEHYQILTREDGTPLELGRGAMGVTYKGFDIDLRLPVTLKVISEKYVGDESARLRFLREARAAAKVRHTNVASVLHLGRTGNGYFYAMELVEGETLESLIQRCGQLEVKLALEIAGQVAAGLAAVHKQNLVHRDIKPSNIMVSLEEGVGVTAKIIDLGLAKGVGEAAPESAISVPGGFAGTPEFASPEQFAGVGVDIRSDLYSVGVTLWVMLSGRPPFRGTPAELIYQHQHGVLQLEQLKGVPHQVTALLEMLLEKDPKRRFQTPVELLNRISTVRSELEKPARRTRLSRPKPQQRSVAVLPFESLSASKKDTYFADGVQDEILSNLAKLSQLKVISRSSVMTYRPAANRNLRAIANELGVARVIEGTVRRSGNRVRISTRLVDAQTGETLWSESYDRNLTDIFAIQSEIAQEVASKLNVHLSRKQRKGIEEKITNDLEAYDLYLRAKEIIENCLFFSLGAERNSLLDAIRLLEEAMRRDNQFALAYCLITKAHDDLYYWNFDNTPERRALGDAALNEALRLRPDLAEVHLASAYHLSVCYRNYERARVQLAIAQTALPNSPQALELAAYIDGLYGNWEDSTKAMEKAVSLDPRNPQLLQSLNRNYLHLRRYRELQQTCNRLIQLSPDKPTFKLQKAGAVFLATVDLARFRASLENLRPAMEERIDLAYVRLFAAVQACDWSGAREILNHSCGDDFPFLFYSVVVPKACIDLWISRLERGHSPTERRFVVARDQLKRKVDERPEDARLLAALSLVDAALGRKEEAIEEARHAVEMLPVSQDGWDGPLPVLYQTRVYALTAETDLALKNLAVSVKTPGGEYYCDLKLDPSLNVLRKDPRFEKLLAQLSPNQSLQKMPSGASLVRTNKRSVRSGPKNISIARLPVTGIELFGREEDIAFLDRPWANKDVNVVTIVAWAGVGKSTLINHWLRRMAADHYRSAELVFGWSFYRQGTSGDTSSADEFVDAALTWFGDPDPRLGTGWEKGERLAKLVAARRTLLILDGLEPLQNPPGPQEGRLRDPALQALLRELAAFNKGLCVITTRTPIADIVDHEHTSAPRRDLEQLSSEAGTRLLSALGVKGDEADLRTASEEFDGHCLALTLLGSYLTDAYNGDIHYRNEVSGRLSHDVRQGAHARKVMESYQAWFGEGPELPVLRVLGLFDRPADEKALGALLKPPAIGGLTESLISLSSTEWRTILAKLRRARLLAPEDQRNPGYLDAHPLVREYFGDQLRSQQTEAWKECNRRLYHYYRTVAPELPNNFREMEPLFLAVISGCNAGLFCEALHEVYITRIQRGDAYFAANVLGARGPLLSVLVHFFEGGRWGSLLETAIEGQGLTAEDQLFVLMQAATYLTATRGPGAPEAQICYERAESLSHSFGHPAFVYTLIGQWRYTMNHDKLSAAMRVAERVYSLAHEQHDPALMILAYNAFAATLLSLGDFESAGEYAMQAVQIWRSGAAKAYPEDVDTPVVGCLCYKAASEWHRGETASCKAKLAEAISVAKELKDMLALAGAVGWAAFLAAIESNPAEVDLLASELIELSVRHGFLRWQAIGTLHRGWALCASGSAAEGIPYVEQGIRDLRATGVVHSSHLRLKAEALYLARHVSEALEAINEAEKVAERSEEHQWWAELQRLRGVFLAAIGADETQIETAFCAAIRIAKEQKSVSLAKRAEASYAEYRGKKPRVLGTGGLRPEKISVARLPVTGSDLFGREEDIAFLDRAWANQDVNVVTIVAWAGVGKSTLINHWLRRMAADHYRSAELIFGWSFYRQGTSGETSSADEFLDAALGWFGDPDPRLGTAWEKGERLAKLVAQRRTLLILDGLEPLQNPPGPQEGRIREPSLQALLRELAAFNKGLCVISTRTPVADIADHEQTSALRCDLEHLSSEDGAQLLRALGVKGDDAELRSASDEFRGHCLALTLLGSYLADPYNGDIRCRSEVSGQLGHDVRQGVHARKVMESYQTWFGEGPELAVLRMLGLFDRPADEKAIAALLESPAIPGFTESLTDLSKIQWRTIIARLRRTRLLAAEDPNNPGQLDAHPLVREYFGEQLRTQRTGAWKESNRRLYNYYRALAPELPETFREMEPLFLAVIHGCNAGLFRETLREVYIPRIQRENSSFAANVLGARGTLLSVLGQFFENGWESAVVKGTEGHSLTEEDELFILLQAGQYLSATRGFGTPGVRVCFERAESLCHTLSRPDFLYVSLMGQWRHLCSTDKGTARLRLAKRIYSLARKQDDFAQLIGACSALAMTNYALGDFEASYQYAIRGVELWRSGGLQSTIEELEVPSIACLRYVALCQWHNDNTTFSQTTIEQAISLARALNDMHGLAAALDIAASLACDERNLLKVELYSSELVELSTRHRFAVFTAIGAIYRGWALSAAGKSAEGILSIEQGIRDIRASGDLDPAGYYLVLKAQALYLADRSCEALETIKEVEFLAERFENRSCDALLLRLRGIFLTAVGAGVSEIESSFSEAIRVAKQQKSVLWAKRAEATFAEYRRRKASAAGGGRELRLPL